MYSIARLSSWIVLAAAIFFTGSFLFSEEEFVEQVYNWQKPPHRKRPRAEFVKTAQHIDLKDALFFTLENNVSIKIAKMVEAQQVGTVRLSAGPFNPILSATATNSYNTDVITGTTRSNESIIVTTSTVSASKMMRSGTLMALTASVDRTHDGSIPKPNNNLNYGTIAFKIVQPLLRGFRYGKPAMTEVVAILELQAAYWTKLQAISQSIYDASVLYWELVSAVKVLKVQEEALGRYAVIVEQTKSLIASGLSARSEIDQPLAQLAAQQVTVTLAQEDLFNAYHNFKFGIGDENICLPFEIELVLEDFPEIVIDSVAYQKEMDNFLIEALDRRFDIQAALIQEEVAETNLLLAENDWLPILNITAGIANSDFANGSQAKPLFTTWDMTDPQTDWAIGFEFSYPLFNDRGSGAIQQQTAARWQAHYERQLIVQTAIRDIRETTIDILALTKALVQVNYAVQDYQDVVDNESSLLQEGMITIFEYIEYQDRLTNALTSRILIQKQLTKAVANLRFLTATLITEEPDCTYAVVDSRTVPFGGVKNGNERFQK